VKYHDFVDVFSKQKANKLAPHRPYDLKIDIDKGTHPPLGPIYPLSQPELSAIHEFLDEHLYIGFIRPTKSLYGAPVFFIKKKDGSLKLCMDFHGLNAITQKDKYPLPLITDLLDAPHAAHIYTNIDLKSLMVKNVPLILILLNIWDSWWGLMGSKCIQPKSKLSWTGLDLTRLKTLSLS
jgi:hypothetical protein